MAPIASIRALEILDSRGLPTVEVEVRLEDGGWGRAAVPVGASVGSAELPELRDRERDRYLGMGVRRSVALVNEVIGPELRGWEASDQPCVDEYLAVLGERGDGEMPGSNSTLGISLAIARATADSLGAPLYRTLSRGGLAVLPVPLFSILNGGAHADNPLVIEEFMVAPVSASSFHEALRMGAEVYQTLKSVMNEIRYGSVVGDEGGFAPELRSNVEAIELLLDAIEDTGLSPGDDVVLALDSAASQFYRDGAYLFPEARGTRHGSEDMIALYESWLRQFPIWSIEDPLAESDGEGWRLLTQRLGGKVLLVGDDLFVTDAARIRAGMADSVANAAAIKPNQIGTLSATLEAIAAAHSGGYATVVSHRAGDTVDDFIADLAVGSAAGLIKSGAPARGERVAKYNRLLRIEEELGPGAVYAGTNAFRRRRP